jgi:hypothetical protein
MKLSDAIAYLSKEWHVFFAWIETLIVHHQAGTLPPAPQPGQSAIISGTTTSGTAPPTGATGAAPALNLPAGVTYVDSINGLVKLDAADAVYPGQHWCVFPMLAEVPAGTQAWATINYNTATAKSADNGLGLHVRVNTMITAKNSDGTEGWTNSYPFVWLDNAWSVGSEFPTWDAAIAKAVEMATNLVKAAANTGGGSGFVPHH